ncbi:MAG: hypothetical protein AABX01_05540 [Candidatus Micrarchaeota archaeon]
MVFEEMEAQYEEFAEGMREKGIPLPSFTMLLGIIGFIIVIIAVLLLNPFASKTTNLTVKILAGDSPVDKARVSIFDFKENLLTEGLTGKDGSVTFESIPAHNIVIRALKKEIGQDEKKLQNTPKIVTIVIGGGDPSVGANGSVEITLALSDESSGKPISTASINYAFPDEPGKKFKAITGSDGKAKVTMPLEKAASMAIEHPDYEPKTITLTASAEKKNIDVKMKRRIAGATPNPSIKFEYGTLRITVRGPNGESIDANVDLYDATINSQVASKSAVNGKVSFANLLTGSKYFVKAQMDGYLPYDGSLRLAEIGKTNELEVVMRKAADKPGNTKGTLTVRTTDEDGKEIYARVLLVSQESVVNEKISSGKVQYDLSQLSSLESFGFVATSEGKLPASSETFSPDSVPNEIALSLQTATSENSAKLKVVTKGKKGVLVSGAQVKVYAQASGFLLGAISESDGTASFVLPIGGQFTIISEYGGVKGIADITLDSDKELTIFLGEAVESVKVLAVNAQTGDEVEATFLAQYGNDTFDSCFGIRCSLFVRTLQDVQIKVSADGYFERIAGYKPSGEGTEFKIDMIPTDFDGTFFKLIGIYDEIGREVQSVEADSQYNAKFLIAAPFADKAGAYFRIGKETTTDSDVAAITGYSATPSATTLTKGASFSATSKCDDEQGSEFKWMNAEFGKSESQEIGFKFKVKLNGEKDSEIRYYYRGYAVTDGKYLRIPEDEVLGTNEKSAIVDWCKAKASEGKISIAKSGISSCSSAGCLTVSLEQDGMRGERNFQARVAKGCVNDASSLNSCARSALKVIAKFKPNEAGREFAVSISQQNGNLKFSDYKINGEGGPSSSKGISATLMDAKEYAIAADSIPQEAGNEKIAVTVEDASGDLSVSKSIDFKIYGSCGEGLKDCGGRCELICLKDAFADLTDEEKNQEEITPKPQCVAGEEYCSDGVCRESCEITRGSEGGGLGGENGGGEGDGATLPPEITLEIKDGKIELKDGRTSDPLKKISMQIDAFVPADAIELNASMLPKGCVPLYKIAEGITSACYAIKNSHLVFQGNEISADCKLKSFGDEAIGDKSAKLKISCVNYQATPTEIPIEVAVNKIPFKTVQLAPKSLAGSSSKVFHLINEKQVQKDYQLASLALSIDHADAYSYAWSGDGSLELREGDKLIDSLDYTREETYFPTIDNQGGRIAACYDAFCCSSKWCTTPAAGQAFLKFKDAAKKVADASAFRRGNKFISEKVLGKPFSFSTVIRLIEKAQLPDEVKLEDSPNDYGCQNENPKIYAVQAYSSDGKKFDFTARVARLYKFNYVDEGVNCKGGKATPESKGTPTHSYYSGGNYLPLCDFLGGKAACVESEAQSSLASQEQVATKRQLTPIPVPSTFVTALIGAASCRALTAAVDSEYATCLTSCGTATIGIGLAGGCEAYCWGLTAPQCAAGSSGPHPDIPAVLPFPRFTTILCGPSPIGSPITPPVCMPLCNPKSSYVHVVPFNKQLYGAVHVGIRASCFPDLVGAGIVTTAFYGAYQYPKYSGYINAMASLTSSAIVGDLSTCGVLAAIASTQPDSFVLQGASLSCTVISEMKSLKSIFGGKAKVDTPKVKKINWDEHFNNVDPSEIAKAGDIYNSQLSTTTVTQGLSTNTQTSGTTTTTVTGGFETRTETYGLQTSSSTQGLSTSSSTQGLSSSSSTQGISTNTQYPVIEIQTTTEELTDYSEPN